MHSIRIPTDQDLQNYPHVFFTSPDIWDASVLDHEITPSLLEDINQHFDDSLLQDSIFDEYGDLHHRATDTIFSDTPAINDGSTMAQFFVGRDTLVGDAYGIKTQKQFINTLYDNIRSRGAMTTLITDGGRYEISKKVADRLRSLFIKQHESEPYHQHQNKAEQRYGVVKRYINTLLNLTGAPAHCWLLCILYVCHLLNATASPALGGLTPLQALTGQDPDISHFLHFSFWEPIYYKVDES